MNEEDIQSLLTKVERRERTTRKRVLVYSFVPVVLAGLLLWFTTHKIIQARQELDAVNDSLERARKEAVELRENLGKLEEQLRQSSNFAKHMVDVDLGDTKSLASHHDLQPQAIVLERIIAMKDAGVAWKLGGRSPNEGFDSPSFAAYIIREFTSHDVPVSGQSRLRQSLTPVSSPGIGDVVFYETGYTMFYFKRRNGRPFCIGMTPVGIVALEIDFGPKVLGYGRVEY
jgi:cell wall-associated NlpC family hydrolase